TVVGRNYPRRLLTALAVAIATVAFAITATTASANSPVHVKDGTAYIARAPALTSAGTRFPADRLIVINRSLGGIPLGATTAQVRKKSGRPDQINKSTFQFDYNYT